MKYNEREPQEHPSEHPNFYQTGVTEPPKRYSILVAILLVMVIFMAGLVSLMGLINIKMFNTLYEEEQEQEVPVSLETQQMIGALTMEDIVSPETKMIGITGESVTAVYQRHFNLPEGLFITFVAEGTSAHRQGVQEGDVLLTLEDTKITTAEELRSFLEARTIGDAFEAVIYRRDTDSQLKIQLTIEEAVS